MADRVRWSGAAALMLVAACSGGNRDASGTVTASVQSGSTSSAIAVSANDGATQSASASASSGAGGAAAVKEENALYDFDYAWPAAAGAIPGLRAWLEADRAKTRTALIADAKAAQAEAKSDGIEYHAYAKGLAWKKVAEIPDWLSLSGQGYEYTGGAHPNSWSQSLVWDKTANVRRAVTDLFASKAALDKAIQAPFCDKLDVERAKRRQAPVNRNSGDEFDKCIAPSEQTVILGSSDGKAFNRIGVLSAPYNAGPYAEGEYEITVPVTSAVMAAVKPEYRASFAVR